MESKKKNRMKCAVAAGSIETARTVIDIIEKGGNAIDAAIAGVFTSFLSEPLLTSIAGGGYMLVRLSDKLASEKNEGNKEKLFDFFVTMPRFSNKEINKKKLLPVEVDFGDTQQTFYAGGMSVGFPGNLYGLLHVHRKLGTLPLSDLLQSAIDYAKKGTVVNKFQSHMFHLLHEINNLTIECASIYGKKFMEGEIFKNEKLGEFFEKLQENSDYTVNHIYNKGLMNVGSCFSKEDIENYRVEDRSPIKGSFYEYNILTNPPPSPGGTLILFSLKLVEKVGKENIRKLRHNSESYIKFLVNIMEQTTKFRKTHVDNPRNKKIKKNNKVNYLGNTTHLSLIDSEGNAVSVTTSNGEGSGILLGETGILTNNMLGEEDLNPCGFFNQEPGMRLPSMMSPTFLIKNGKIKAVLGSGGSNRIRSAIVQTIMNLVIFDMNIKEAVEAPRIHFENNMLFLEKGIEENTVKKLDEYYNGKVKIVTFKKKDVFFGGLHAVTDSFEGKGDSRRSGEFLKTG